MSITINGDTGVAGVDGSASTPALQGNDTNSGIAFPAADTVTVATDGTERMRIDSSGNVGIGTSSPATILNAYSATAATIAVDGDSTTLFRASRYSDDVAGANFVARKGRGTLASPTAVNSTDVCGTIGFQGFGGTNFRVVAQIQGLCQTYTSDTNISGALIFATNSGSTAVTEKMRITAAGEVYIASTTDQGAYNLQCNGTGVWGAGAYVNGSDARIKEDVAPIDSGLDVVEKLNPVTYRYKEDWSKDQSVQTGFIAQELLVALDGKNYVDGIVQQGGPEGYYSVAYQNIIPILTKAIQELNAKVEAQAAEIAALKGQV